MNSLVKRIDVLEQRDMGEKKLLWVSHAPNGLVHGGKLYAGADGLLQSLALKDDEAHLIGWMQG